MYLHLLKDFLSEANDFMKDFNNLLDSEAKETKEEECDDEPKSYYHYMCDKYENGKHVSHKEKEVKDGKVLKDVDNCMNIEDKTENKKESCNCEKQKVENKEEKDKNVCDLKQKLADMQKEHLKMEEHLRFMEKRFTELKEHTHNLKSQLEKVTSENTEYKRIMEKIKNIL